MVYYIGYKNVGEKYPDFDFVDFDFKEAVAIDTIGSGREYKRMGVDAFQSGLPISPDHVPHRARWGSRSDPVDYITLRGSSCISPRMKAIIERFEPDVHQFFLLSVVNKAGEEIAQRWLWVVCNRIDSVDREHTTYKLVNDATWMSNYLDGDTRVRIEGAILYFSNRQSAGYHFWRDKHLIASNGILCSDEAAQALQFANLTALAVGPARSI